MIPTPDHLLEPGRPLVGIASPYTTPDPITNIRLGARFATALWTCSNGDLVPVLPNANLVWDMIAPLPYEAWLAITMAVIVRCDAIVRLPGESSGADLEVERAESLGIPVLYAHPYDLDDPAAKIVPALHAALAWSKGHQPLSKPPCSTCGGRKVLGPGQRCRGCNS